MVIQYEQYIGEKFPLALQFNQNDSEVLIDTVDMLTNGHHLILCCINPHLCQFASFHCSSQIPQLTCPLQTECAK